MIKNKDSAKHLAQAVRIFALSQFAHYGIVSLNNIEKSLGDAVNINSDILLFTGSVAMVLFGEYVGFKILNRD